jgi:hypothetical protein
MRLFMLCLGLAGLAVGLALVVVFSVRTDDRLRNMGLLYMVGAAALLALRRLLSFIVQRRKERLKQRRAAHAESQKA